jgi:hypothetical protein
MREKGSIIASMLLGATLFAPSSVQAVPLAGGKAAIHQATTTQQVRCRSSRRNRCYYVSRPERAIRYNRSNRNGMYPGEAEYNYHYWGSPLNDP